MEIIHPNAAGIDVGAESIYVAAPKRVGEPRVREFGTFTTELTEMAEWLKGCGVDTVAMESTGVYWIGTYAALEEKGIKVCLVNGKHYRNVPGRKSDVQDSEWLRDLHTVGLLRGSFIPDDDTRVMREYLRQREVLVSSRAMHDNRMHRVMVQMNIRLDTVLSDITGQSGMAIMRAIAAGERDANALLKLRNHRCKTSPEDFVKALTGQYRSEHVFGLKQALALHDAYSAQIKELDEQIKAHLDQVNQRDEQQPAPPPLEASRKKNTNSKNKPNYDVRATLYKLAGVDLTQIDGIHESTAQIVISEIGVDMSPWPDAGHFASWLGLCPRKAVTGNKVKHSHTLKGNRRMSHALRMSAQALLKSKAGLGAYARQMRARKGSAFAIVATAHKLARIIYTMLKHKHAFLPQTADQFDEARKKREHKALQRRAANLGFQLTPLKS